MRKNSINPREHSIKSPKKTGGAQFCLKKRNKPMMIFYELLLKKRDKRQKATIKKNRKERKTALRGQIEISIRQYYCLKK